MDFSEPQTGQTVSHYRLLSKLGEGGMGVVYAAEDTHLGRRVAVKFLSAGHHKRLSRARFLREARSASLLSHPNIATVYDYGETDDSCPFIVMELLHGETLSEVLAAGGLTVERSLSVVRSVLEALSEAHRHGVVHRDIKPSNILIGEHGQVKVLDFGLAKVLRDESSVGLDSDGLSALPTQTLSGTVLGTPLYVSPEQATSAHVDQRSDLFSVGAVLYECLALRPAFAAPSVVEIFALVISPVAPPSPSSFNPAIPPELDRVTLKALAKAPERRHQSAEEFLEELRRVRPPAQTPDGPPRQVFGPSLEALYRKIVSRSHRPSAPPRPVEADGAPRRQRAVMAAGTCVAVLILLLLAGSFYVRPASRPNSVAVLPFANEVGDENFEYFSDGLTDSLINSLSKSARLKVISRNSVAKYKGRPSDPAEVGSALNVQAVLTGRVRRIGGEIHVAVELADTRDGSRLWGWEYRKSLSELPSAQQEAALEIADRLGRHLGADADGPPSRGRQANPAAQDLYRKGRWHWNKMTGEGVKQAIVYYQQAIDLDPTYALAYAGLADAFVINNKVRPRDSYMRAKAAVAKALEYDDTLGEAHATLGLIRAHYERDWDGADANFERAIRLNPNYATAHHWYADALLARGRYEDALRETEWAQRLDPLSPIINTDLGLCYFYMRRYDEAAVHFRRMTEVFPNFWPAYYHLGWTYTQQRKYDEAVEQYRKALSLSDNHTMPLALLGYTYAVSGREAEARDVLSQLESLTARQYVSPYRFAILYTGLGEKDRAFQWLNKAYDELDILLIYVREMPFFDPIREDPRFGELLHRLRLLPL